jgi:hypothetical protein
LPKFLLTVWEECDDMENHVHTIQIGEYVAKGHDFPSQTNIFTNRRTVFSDTVRLFVNPAIFSTLLLGDLNPVQKELFLPATLEF